MLISSTCERRKKADSFRNMEDFSVSSPFLSLIFFRAVLPDGDSYVGLLAFADAEASFFPAFEGVNLFGDSAYELERSVFNEFCGCE